MRKYGLLVVDIQRDFCPGGSLPVPEGDRILPAVNRYLALFASLGLPIFASRDWHPEKTRHFAPEGLWPPHCIAGTPGAGFHPGLRLPLRTILVSKGTAADRDDYSAFDGTTGEDRLPLAAALRSHDVTHLFIGGLTAEYCVRTSTLDALREGFDVYLLKDAIMGLERFPGDAERVLRELSCAGATPISFDDACSLLAPL